MQAATENTDGRLIAELSQKIHQCQLDIDRDFEEFETLSESAESRRTAYARKLKELDEIDG